MRADERTMRELSLFSGCGGGLLGSLILGWRTVAAVEIDPWCRRVLAARFPDLPVCRDVRTFDGTAWRGKVDIVTGGFPCQPFSQAGKRLGEDDPRNMWPHAVRILVESGAPLGFFENVPGLLSSGYFGTVLGDLAEAGFDAEWCVLGADDVGAPHRRKRLWILAHRDAGEHVSGGPEGVPDADDRQPVPEGVYGPADVGHSDEQGLQGHGREHELSAASGQGAAVGTGGGPEDDIWLALAPVGRVAHVNAAWLDLTGAAQRKDVP